MEIELKTINTLIQIYMETNTYVYGKHKKIHKNIHSFWRLFYSTSPHLQEELKRKFVQIIGFHLLFKAFLMLPSYFSICVFCSKGFRGNIHSFQLYFYDFLQIYIEYR